MIRPEESIENKQPFASQREGQASGRAVIDGNEQLFLNIKPSTLNLQPSFGFGDRLGVATEGHVAALRQSGGSIKGIFVQQSAREMDRTKRTPADVMQAAQRALLKANFKDVWGADADHLKTFDHARHTAEAGFTFFTIDPSEYVARQADDYPLQVLEDKFDLNRSAIDWFDTYLNKTEVIPRGPTILFDRPTVLRAAVKYGRAITHTLQMIDCIRQVANERHQPYEIELSVDETDQPTSFAEHYIIADQIRRHGAQLVSLAPRFVGDFEKGIDFKGNLTDFAASLASHAAIARHVGPYKLSLHSGSDKLSIYRLFAHATGGLFHVKTAGTSYMEALRVVAECAPEIFREILSFARDRYDTDKFSYHVSATTLSVPAPESVSDDRQLQRLYLGSWSDVQPGYGFSATGRQILHCTFGSVLNHPQYGPLVHQILRDNSTIYRDILVDHFTRHLQALQPEL